MDGDGFNLQPCLSFWVNFSGAGREESENFSGQRKVASDQLSRQLHTTSVSAISKIVKKLTKVSNSQI